MALAAAAGSRYRREIPSRAPGLVQFLVVVRAAADTKAVGAREDLEVVGVARGGMDRVRCWYLGVDVRSRSSNGRPRRLITRHVLCSVGMGFK